MSGLVSTILKKMVFQYLMLIISWNENCYFAKSRTINFNHWKKKQKVKNPWKMHGERRERGTQTTFAGQIARAHTRSPSLFPCDCITNSCVINQVEFCVNVRVFRCTLPLSLSFTLTHECRAIFSHYYNFFRFFCGFDIIFFWLLPRDQKKRYGWLEKLRTLDEGKCSLTLNNLHQNKNRYATHKYPYTCKRTANAE